MSRFGFFLAASLLGAMAMAATPAAESAPLSPRTWELFGSAALEAGAGSTLDVDGGAGYFVSPVDELGGRLGLHLDGIQRLRVGPFYQHHFAADAATIVPYVGAGTDLVYDYIRAQGGRNPQPASHDFSLDLAGVAGLKIFAQARWALIVELALRWRGVAEANDFVMGLTAGLAGYL